MSSRTSLQAVGRPFLNKDCTGGENLEERKMPRAIRSLFSLLKRGDAKLQGSGQKRAQQGSCPPRQGGSKGKLLALTVTTAPTLSAAFQLLVFPHLYNCNHVNTGQISSKEINLSLP